MLARIAAALAVLFCSTAFAQPFNVRAWYAQGQVFVVWQFPAPPALPYDTIEVYSSATPQATTGTMNRIGRLFFPEYTGGRLSLMNAGARLLVPTPAGGTYRLAVDEGVFVFTPHAAGSLFFAVVDTGSNVVVAGNSATCAFNYDPVNEPVVAHWQFDTFTPGGNPSAAYVVWADGRPNHNDHRPDFPVTADPDKNGVPHVFAITRPVTPLPAQPLSCAFVMHGGGDLYHLFRPGQPQRSNMSLQMTDGIVVSPDDAYYIRRVNVLELTETNWFGYTPWCNPFDPNPWSDPPSTEVVVNYTQRRVHWVLNWLLGPQSPYDIDESRVVMVGHSMGARGTSHLTRLRPERFAAAVLYCPPADLTQPPNPLQQSPLRGQWSQNLATNLIDAGGAAIGFTDAMTFTTPLSTTQRDIPLTRTYTGKRDEQGAAEWNAAQRAVLDLMNASRWGFMVHWDEREHAIEQWHLESNDATDSHAGPWPDVAQWVAPVRTVRSSLQYLVDTYRNNQTYPGFFNSDHNTAISGRQPDPGAGDPDLGDPWGTWSGYFDWEPAITDTSAVWEAVVFATGLSAASIDNSPVAAITADVAPRRAQAFITPPGTVVDWVAKDHASGAVLQQGQVVADGEGVTAVPGLAVPRDPARVRLTLTIVPPPPCGSADFDCDGDVGTDADIEGFFACLAGTCPPPPCTNSADFNNDGDIGTDADIEAFFRVLAGGPC